jgi:hypothetical protein
MFVKSKAETVKMKEAEDEGEAEELFPSAFGQRCVDSPDRGVEKSQNGQIAGGGAERSEEALVPFRGSSGSPCPLHES